MPGQRSARARARGSWALRLAGIAVAVLLAGGGAALYVVAGQGHGKPAARLSGRVAGVQTVGLAAPGPATQPTAGQPAASAGLLLASPHGLIFSPANRTDPPASYPEWTADQMVGGSYIFIYISTGQCLSAAAGQAATLRRCDLSQWQRWTRAYYSTNAAGDGLWQLRNGADGRCLTVGGPVAAATATGSVAALQRCGADGSWRQLIAFWSG
jgi:Ricin-type beta-trefoil lectin domain-like